MATALAAAPQAPSGAPSDWWTMMVTLQVLGPVYGLSDVQTGFLMAFYPLAPNLVKQTVGLPSQPDAFEAEWKALMGANDALKKSSEPDSLLATLATAAGVPVSALQPVTDPDMYAQWRAIIDKVYAVRKQWADDKATPEAKAAYEAKLDEVVDQLNKNAIGAASKVGFQDAVAKAEAKQGTDWAKVAKWGAVGVGALLLLMLWRPWR